MPGAHKRDDGKVTTTLRLDPAIVTEWQMFCADYGMPLNDAIEAAMELYMTVTAEQEQRLAENEDDNEPYIQIA